MCLFDIIDLLMMAVTDYHLTKKHKRLLNKVLDRFLNLSMEGF